MKAAGWVLMVILLCLLPATMMVLLVRGLVPQEAAGQETTTPQASPPATTTQASPPATFSSVPAESTEHPQGIPGLGVMDVVGNLEHFPLRGGGGRFACAGPVPGDGEATLWACSVASGEGGVSHEVVVAGEDPASVLWVRATARGVSEEEAAGFLG